MLEVLILDIINQAFLHKDEKMTNLIIEFY